MEQLTKFLNWLAYDLPGIIGAFAIGRNLSAKKEAELERDLLDSETKRKLLENEITVAKNTLESDPVDVLNKIAGRGDDDSKR